MKKSILSDLRPIKIEKKPGTTYCFGCKNYTKNIRKMSLYCLSN